MWSSLRAVGECFSRILTGNSCLLAANLEFSGPAYLQLLDIFLTRSSIGKKKSVCFNSSLRYGFFFPYWLLLRYSRIHTRANFTQRGRAVKKNRNWRKLKRENEFVRVCGFGSPASLFSSKKRQFPLDSAFLSISTLSYEPRKVELTDNSSANANTFSHLDRKGTLPKSVLTRPTRTYYKMATVFPLPSLGWFLLHSLARFDDDSLRNYEHFNIFAPKHTQTHIQNTVIFDGKTIQHREHAIQVFRTELIVSIFGHSNVAGLVSLLTEKFHLSSWARTWACVKKLCSHWLITPPIHMFHCSL